MTSLTFTTCDLRRSANTTAHRTDKYTHDQLIVRRGESVVIQLTMSRAMQRAESLSLISELGPSPSESTNTRIIMPISATLSKTTWSASSSSTSSKEVVVTFYIPSNACIGKYTLFLQILSGGRTSKVRLGFCNVLFNAWSKEDSVYMSNEAERAEYVENENGFIFFGNANRQGSRYWDMGQCEQGILDAVFTMLDKSINYKNNPKEDLSKRYDPVYISRCLSGMVNSNDDDGIIRGNWGGNYTSSNNPSRWNGSKEIILQWVKSGPVSYGQCWVFAGVLCSAFRAIGIPCCVITNYNSAHDTDKSLTIDSFYDSSGRPLPETADSVWNFHVWNQIWCTRPDLGPNYGGWQIVDATPQEPSGGIYCLGPASLRAILAGDVHLPYDGEFVFAEMNADKVNWRVNDDGVRQKLSTDTRSVGQFTSTKAVGGNGRVDVTHRYKHAEGSPEERATFKKALANLSAARPMIMGRSAFAAPVARPAAAERSAAPAPTPDYTCKLDQKEKTEIGKNLIVSMILKNTSSETKDINCKTTATVILYTGKLVKEIKTKDISVKLGPKEEKTTLLTIKYYQYKKSLTDDRMIKIVVMCTDEKGQHLVTDYVCTLDTPPLTITFIRVPAINKPGLVEISFANPLAETVAKSTLTAEGTGLLTKLLTIPVDSLNPRQRSVTQFEITPYKPGKRCLLVNFFADNFLIKTHKEVTIAN